MLIVSQDRKTLVNIDSVGQIYIDAYLSNKTSIYCEFADGRTVKLSEYESVEICIKVLESICADYISVAPIFKMPEIDSTGGFKWEI